MDSYGFYVLGVLQYMDLSEGYHGFNKDVGFTNLSD